MADKMYNLQVQISTELADKLKALAKEDERSLRVFCKKILEDYVKNVAGEVVEVKKDIKNNEDAVEFSFDDFE